MSGDSGGLHERCHIEGHLDGPAAKALAIAATLNEYVGKVGEIGQAFNTATGKLDPAHFKSLSDFSGKAGQIMSAAMTVVALSDTSSLTAFKANPSYATAKAWGNKVGALLDGVSALAGGIPVWGDVVKGTLKMPKIVIDRFASLVEKRYAAIDAKTRETCGSEMLEEGTSSQQCDVAD